MSHGSQNVTECQLWVRCYEMFSSQSVQSSVLLRCVRTARRLCWRYRLSVLVFGYLALWLLWYRHKARLPKLRQMCCPHRHQRARLSSLWLKQNHVIMLARCVEIVLRRPCQWVAMLVVGLLYTVQLILVVGGNASWFLYWSWTTWIYKNSNV